MNNCVFSFKGKIFKQISGSPMGSPVSPVLANLVMEYIEGKVLQGLDFQPLMYKRYVDDIFAIIPSDRFQYFFDSFNDFHSSFKFTFEIEQEGFLPFLELKVIHCEDGSVMTDLFRKSTWSGRYLNYDSHLPLTYKRNTVSLMAKKILQFSNSEFHVDNFSLLRRTLLANGYPLKFLDRILDETCATFGSTTSLRNVLTSSTLKFMSIPYIPGLFEKFKRLFEKYDVKVVGKGENNVRKKFFSSLKDTDVTDVQSGVVYQVPCLGCAQVYIGNTIQYVKRRMGNHKTGISNKNPDYSALVRHSLENPSHVIDFANVCVLDKEPRQKKREVLEMLHIAENIENCMNVKTDSMYVPNCYKSFLKL
jgi:hypothetical protein